MDFICGAFHYLGLIEPHTYKNKDWLLTRVKNKNTVYVNEAKLVR